MSDSRVSPCMHTLMLLEDCVIALALEGAVSLLDSLLSAFNEAHGARLFSVE